MDVNGSRADADQQGVPISLVFGGGSVPPVDVAVPLDAGPRQSVRELASAGHREDLRKSKVALIEHIRAQTASMRKVTEMHPGSVVRSLRAGKRRRIVPGGRADEMQDLIQSVEEGVEEMEGGGETAIGHGALTARDDNPVGRLLEESIHLVKSAGFVSSAHAKVIHRQTGGRARTGVNLDKSFERLTRNKWTRMQTDVQSVNDSSAEQPDADATRNAGATGADLEDFVDRFIGRLTRDATEQYSMRRSRILEVYSDFLFHQIDRLSQAADELRVWWSQHPVHVMSDSIKSAASLPTDRHSHTGGPGRGYAWEASDSAVKLVLSEAEIMGQRIRQIANDERDNNTSDMNLECIEVLVATCQAASDPTGDPGGDSHASDVAVSVVTEVTEVTTGTDTSGDNGSAIDSDMSRPYSGAPGERPPDATPERETRTVVSRLCRDPAMIGDFFQTWDPGFLTHESGPSVLVEAGLQGFVKWLATSGHVDMTIALPRPAGDTVAAHLHAQLDVIERWVKMAWATQASCITGFVALLVQATDENNDIEQVRESEQAFRQLEERHLLVQQKTMAGTAVEQAEKYLGIEPVILSSAKSVFNVLRDDYPALNDRRLTLEVFWDRSRNSLADVFYKLVAYEISLQRKVNGVRSTTNADTKRLAMMSNQLRCEFEGACLRERLVEVTPPFSGGRHPGAKSIKTNLVVVESANDSGGGAIPSMQGTIGHGPCPIWFIGSSPHRKIVEALIPGLWREENPLSQL